MTNEQDQRIITPLPASLLKAVDDYRFERRLPSRAAAIRRLLKRGLEVEAASSEKPQ